MPDLLPSIPSSFLAIARLSGSDVCVCVPLLVFNLNQIGFNKIFPITEKIIFALVQVNQHNISVRFKKKKVVFDYSFYILIVYINLHMILISCN